MQARLSILSVPLLMCCTFLWAVCGPSASPFSTKLIWSLDLCHVFDFPEMVQMPSSTHLDVLADIPVIYRLLVLSFHAILSAACRSAREAQDLSKIDSPFHAPQIVS